MTTVIEQKYQEGFLIEVCSMTPAEKRKWRLMQLQQVQAENRKHIKKPRKGKR